ncbi:MAG: type II toxin-antitoxin system Phd/YefM family antitoxin [Saprospiraceae bacterium]|nr:type II toxin-antitoxin system Phd/YefM family antitoxin [Saprospiraceae bacterium]
MNYYLHNAVVQNNYTFKYRLIVKNITEFRKSMKETLDVIHKNDETVILARADDRDVVMISFRSFNSIPETLYLMASKTNRQRLDSAIEDIENSMNLVQKNLLL